MVVLLCTLSVFLFSGPVGPYSVVHGPVTAMRARQASLVLFWSMVAAALNIVLSFSVSVATRVHPLALELSTLTIRQPDAMLRC
jgi:hypothetical protein